MNIQQFKAKWQGSTLKERPASQEHLIDLCRVLGVPSPAEADRDDAYFVGVLHSRAREVWSLCMGTWLSGPRWVEAQRIDAISL